MKKIKLFILLPIIFALSACVSNGTYLDVLTSPEGADLAKELVLIEVEYNTFKNRIIATTSSVEGKYEALNILVGPGTIPVAGAEALYTGARNFYDNIFNGVEAKRLINVVRE